MNKNVMLLTVFLASGLSAQTTAPPTIVPISKEQHHHLVLENEYVRVYSVEVPPHGETLYHRHDLDYVFVTLGDSDVENVRVGEKPVRLQLKDGEVRFSKGGFAHKAVNNSDKPFRNVTIEILDPNLSTDKSCGCSAAIEKCPCGGIVGNANGPGLSMTDWSEGRTNVMNYTISPRDYVRGLSDVIAIGGKQPGLLVAISPVNIQQHE